MSSAILLFGLGLCGFVMGAAVTYIVLEQYLLCNLRKGRRRR